MKLKYRNRCFNQVLLVKSRKRSLLWIRGWKVDESLLRFLSWSFLHSPLLFVRDSHKEQRDEGRKGRLTEHKGYAKHSIENLDRSQKIFSSFYSDSIALAWLVEQFSEHETIIKNDGYVLHSVRRVSWNCALSFSWEGSKYSTNTTSLLPGRRLWTDFQENNLSSSVWKELKQRSVSWLSLSKCPRLVEF